MEWISVKEKLPVHNSTALVYRCGNMHVGIIHHKRWFTSTYAHITDVTHWMPLPEPPHIDTSI